MKRQAELDRELVALNVACGVAHEELQRILFPRERSKAADLAAIRIRRDDLRAGIEALRTARSVFGQRGRA